MGLLGSLIGRATILDYEILFDEGDKVSVSIKAKTIPIKQELIRFLGSYLAKVVYNFGGTNHQSSSIALSSIEKILEKGISKNTDGFNLAGFDDVIGYTKNPGNIVTKFNGSFYGWRNGNRTIATHFPTNATEQQLVYSILALLQFTIEESEEESLEVLVKMLRNMLGMYGMGYGGGINDVIGIPLAAYTEATT